jgi:hypothetical protein
MPVNDDRIIVQRGSGLRHDEIPTGQQQSHPKYNPEDEPYPLEGWSSHRLSSF